MPATYEKHRAQLKAILLSWGMPEENAETTADILSWADLHGVDSHGMSMIPGYDALRRSGRAKMDARPKIVKETLSIALADGGGGLGHVPAHYAMGVAIDKAKKVGMAIAAVNNSAHFGATGYYTLMAANAGLIGMACTSASGIQVAPTFGKQARLGTDPWSARWRPVPMKRAVPASIWRRRRWRPGGSATRPMKICRHRTAGCWTARGAQVTIQWWRGRRVDF